LGREGLSLVPIAEYRPDRAVASTGKWEYGAGANAIARMNCASCTTCCRLAPSLRRILGSGREGGRVETVAPCAW